MIFGLDEHRKESGGGGSKPRIRFGNTGPRGRIHTATPKGGGAVVKSKFIKAGKGARSAIREHLKYIQERERGEGEQERKFFDRERSGIERAEVYDAMYRNRGDKAAMHTIILSPGDNALDIRDYTRESMKALEERMGHKLDWYGVIHTNTDHHHAHVTIAGKIPDYKREMERYEASRAAKQGREMKWDGEERELRELLGPGFDERAQTDPREDRKLEREFGHGMESQEVDPRDRDVVLDKVKYPEELRAEKTIERYEWRMGEPERARSRGDVYIDRNDLNELRAAGNDFLTRERSFDREIERSMDREMSRDLTFDFDRTRERTIEREPERGRDDDSFGRTRSNTREDSHEERGREDDFDRGR